MDYWPFVTINHHLLAIINQLLTIFMPVCDATQRRIVETDRWNGPSCEKPGAPREKNVTRMSRTTPQRLFEQR